LQALSITEIQGWRGELLAFFGVSINPDSVWANFFHGFWYWLPIYFVTFAVGIFFCNLYSV